MKSIECPVMGFRDTDVITMSHGSGGGAMQRLIKEMFAKEFKDLQIDDAASFYVHRGNGLFSVDSFVVHPLFFPGGNIGSLAIHGTVNDLSVQGARPQSIGVTFIIEEGFPLRKLAEIVHSMAEAATQCGVKIITGDTKIVGKGEANGIYITTAGMGDNLGLIGGGIRVGQKIIISGDVARHGMAIMAARNKLDIEPPILSDSAPVNFMIEALYRKRICPYRMRDATRGGVAAVLNEFAEQYEVHIKIDEEKVPVADNVRGLCEILGLNPLHVANEGTFVLFTHPGDVDETVATLRTFENGKNAAIIGEVVGEHKGGLVTATTLLGSEKIIQMPEGELLPRIC